MTNSARNDLLEISWLLAPDSENTVLTRGGADLLRMPYAIPAEAGKGWIDSLAMPEGIVLYRAVHEMEPSARGQLIPILDVVGTEAEPTFNAQIWLSGLACHHEYWDGRDRAPVELVAFPGRDTFRYKRDWDAKVLVEGGVRSEMQSVIIPDGVMTTLLGADVAQALLSGLGLSTKRPAVVVPMPMHISAPLRDSMSSPFAGAARKLFAQARILDYLAGLLNFVLESEVPFTRPTPNQKVDELHSYLVHLQGRMPTLTELSKEFGVSARRLNGDFAAKYGQSIFSFVTDHRLTQAHALLLADPTPIKTIATRLGYSHVNHFSAAFKKKFGYPPGSLRSR